MKTINLKSLRIIFAMFFAIPLFFSCKSDDEDVITYYDTYIDGYITDYNTGAPVQGVIFDAYYFYSDSHGTWFGPEPYKSQNVAVTDFNGYYRIKIPKHGEWGASPTRKAVDFNGIRLFPRSNDSYNYEDAQLMYAENSLSTTNKRINITPKSYGYLKVIMPIDYIERWAINSLEESTYEMPLFKGRFVFKEILNTDKKKLFFKVPIERTRFSYGEYLLHDFDFIINNPRDTVELIIE